jgi:hypothetical protein
MGYGSVNVSGGGIANVQNTIIETFPSQINIPIEDGTQKELELKDFDSDMMTLGGVTTAVENGIYTATITPRAGFCWPDGTRITKQLEWKILAVNAISVPTLKSTAFEFNNGSYNIIGYLENYDSTIMKTSGTISSSSVGSKTFYIGLKDTTKDAWDNGTTSEIRYTWEITKKTVAIPTVEDVTYTGNEIKITPTSKMKDYTYFKFSFKDNEKVVNCGTYTLVISLINTSNSKWVDNSTAKKEVSIKVLPKSIKVPTMAKTHYDYAYKDISPEIDYDDDWCEIISGEIGRNPGSYTLEIKLKDKTNTKWSDGTTANKSFTWNIVSTGESVALPTLAVTEYYPKASIASNTETYYSNLLSSISPNFVYDKNKVKISGDTSKSYPPGTYNAKFDLIYPENSYWGNNLDDKEQKIVSWKINKDNVTENIFRDLDSKITLTQERNEKTFNFEFTCAHFYCEVKYGGNAKGICECDVTKNVTTLTETNKLHVNLTVKLTAKKTGTISGATDTTNYIKFRIYSSSTYKTFDEILKFLQVESTYTPGTLLDLPVQNKVDGEDLTYNGNTQTVSFNYDDTKLTLGGIITGKNAGTYTATFTPISPNTWRDGTTGSKNATWVIKPKKIGIPTVTGGEINSTTYKFTPTISNMDSTYVTASGDNGEQTSVGTKTVVFTLREPSNTCWTDNTVGNKSKQYTISKITASPEVYKYNKGNKTNFDTSIFVLTQTTSYKEVQLVVTKAKGANITVTGDNGSGTVAIASLDGKYNDITDTDPFTLKVCANGSGTTTLKLNISAGPFNNAKTINIPVTSSFTKTKLSDLTDKEIINKLSSYDHEQLLSNFDIGDYYIIKSVKYTETSTDKLGFYPPNTEMKAILIGIDHNPDIEGYGRFHFCIMRDMDDNEIISSNKSRIYDPEWGGTRGYGWFNSPLRLDFSAPWTEYDNKKTWWWTANISDDLKENFYRYPSIKASSIGNKNGVLMNDRCFFFNNKELGLTSNSDIKDIFKDTQTYDFFKLGNPFDISKRYDLWHYTNDSDTLYGTSGTGKNKCILTRSVSSDYKHIMLTNDNKVTESSHKISNSGAGNSSNKNGIKGYPLMWGFTISKERIPTIYKNKSKKTPYIFDYRNIQKFSMVATAGTTTLNDFIGDVDLTGTFDSITVSDYYDPEDCVQSITISNNKKLVIVSKSNKSGFVTVFFKIVNGEMVFYEFCDIFVGARKITDSYDTFKSRIQQRKFDSYYKIGDYFEFQLSSDYKPFEGYSDANITTTEWNITSSTKLRAHVYKVDSDGAHFVISSPMTYKGNDVIYNFASVMTPMFREYGIYQEGIISEEKLTGTPDYIYILNKIYDKMPTGLQNIISLSSMSFDIVNYSWYNETNGVKVKEPHVTTITTKSKLLNITEKDLDYDNTTGMYNFIGRLMKNALAYPIGKESNASSHYVCSSVASHYTAFHEIRDNAKNLLNCVCFMSRFNIEERYQKMTVLVDEGYGGPQYAEKNSMSSINWKNASNPETMRFFVVIPKFTVES